MSLQMLGQVRQSALTGGEVPCGAEHCVEMKGADGNFLASNSEASTQAWISLEGFFSLSQSSWEQNLTLLCKILCSEY